MYPSHQLYPSRHFGFVFFLSLTCRSSSSSLTYRHGIRATLEGEIDLPCCICLPCRRFFALLPAAPLFCHRTAATCHRPDAISRRPDAIPPGRYSASPRPDAIPATSSGRRCSALTPQRPNAALDAGLCCVRSPVVTSGACSIAVVLPSRWNALTPLLTLVFAASAPCLDAGCLLYRRRSALTPEHPDAAGFPPLSCCHLLSTLLRGTAAGSTPHLRRRFLSTSASAAASAALYLPLHYIAGLSSIVAGSSPHGRHYCRIVILGCCSALSASRVAPAIWKTLDCECTGQASLHVRWVQLWALEVRLPRVSQRPWSSASPD